VVQNDQRCYVLCADAGWFWRLQHKQDLVKAIKAEQYPTAAAVLEKGVQPRIKWLHRCNEKNSST
jgi:hypothetical protein